MVNGRSEIELYAVPRVLNYINIICFGVFVFLFSVFRVVTTVEVKQQGQPLYMAVEILSTAWINAAASFSDWSVFVNFLDILTIRFSE